MDEKTFKEKILQERKLAKEQEDKKVLDILEKQEAKKRLEREEHDKRLQLDRVELLKAKQLSTEPPGIFNNDAPKKEYTFKEKVANFFFHYKGWVIAGAIVLIILIGIIHGVITTIRPDYKIIYLTTNYDLSINSDLLGNYLEEFGEDTNNDGSVVVSVLYMPLNMAIESENPHVYSANYMRMMSEFQSGESIIVFADKVVSDKFDLGTVMLNLEDIYPDNAHVEDFAYYLDSTVLGKRIHAESDFPSQIFIGMREVSTGTKYEEEMQKNFDNSMKLFKNFIDAMDVSA